MVHTTAAELNDYLRTVLEVPEHESLIGAINNLRQVALSGVELAREHREQIRTLTEQRRAAIDSEHAIAIDLCRMTKERTDLAKQLAKTQQKSQNRQFAITMLSQAYETTKRKLRRKNEDCEDLKVRMGAAETAHWRAIRRRQDAIEDLFARSIPMVEALGAIPMEVPGLRALGWSTKEWSEEARQIIL